MLVEDQPIAAGSIKQCDITMITTTLVAALFSLGLTLFILWTNPYRFSNQIFALVLVIPPRLAEPGELPERSRMSAGTSPRAPDDASRSSGTAAGG